ncbi:MAG: hypothetical protein LR011_13965 [Verrucomicrobia bacterium]|nr:hypothetical protein [Verrucomicrobiota bacterium]
MKHLLLLLLVTLMLGCSEERKDIINVPSEDTEMKRGDPFSSEVDK